MKHLFLIIFSFLFLSNVDAQKFINLECVCELQTTTYKNGNYSSKPFQGIRVTDQDGNTVWDLSASFADVRYNKTAVYVGKEKFSKNRILNYVDDTIGDCLKSGGGSSGSGGGEVPDNELITEVTIEGSTITITEAGTDFPIDIKPAVAACISDSLSSIVDTDEVLTDVSITNTVISNDTIIYTYTWTTTDETGATNTGTFDVIDTDTDTWYINEVTQEAVGDTIYYYSTVTDQDGNIVGVDTTFSCKPPLEEIVYDPVFAVNDLDTTHLKCVGKFDLRDDGDTNCNVGTTQIQIDAVTSMSGEPYVVWLVDPNSGCGYFQKESVFCGEGGCIADIVTIEYSIISECDTVTAEEVLPIDPPPSAEVEGDKEMIFVKTPEGEYPTQVEVAICATNVLTSTTALDTVTIVDVLDPLCFSNPSSTNPNISIVGNTVTFATNVNVPVGETVCGTYIATISGDKSFYNNLIQVTATDTEGNDSDDLAVDVLPQTPKPESRIEWANDGVPDDNGTIDGTISYIKTDGSPITADEPTRLEVDLFFKDGTSAGTMCGCGSVNTDKSTWQDCGGSVTWSDISGTGTAITWNKETWAVTNGMIYAAMAESSLNGNQFITNQNVDDRTFAVDALWKTYVGGTNCITNAPSSTCPIESINPDNTSEVFTLDCWWGVTHGNAYSQIPDVEGYSQMIVYKCGESRGDFDCVELDPNFNYVETGGTGPYTGGSDNIFQFTNNANLCRWRINLNQVNNPPTIDNEMIHHSHEFITPNGLLTYADNYVSTGFVGAGSDGRDIGFQRACNIPACGDKTINLIVAVNNETNNGGTNSDMWRFVKSLDYSVNNAPYTAWDAALVPLNATDPVQQDLNGIFVDDYTVTDCEIVTMKFRGTFEDVDGSIKEFLSISTYEYNSKF